MHKTAIFKLLGDDKQAALAAGKAECLAMFGAGARPGNKIFEENFDLGNTILCGDYIRVIVNSAFAGALSQLQASGYVSQHMELVRIEWDGQTEFLAREYDDPEFGHVRELLGYIADLPII